MAEEIYRVMIVDDEPLQLSLVGRMLRTSGFRVVSTDSTMGATNMARSFQPHLILLDVQIPGLGGDRLVPLLRRTSPDTLLVLYSACDPDKLRRLSMEVAADAWISKSEDMGKLTMRIKELIVKDLAQKAQQRASKKPPP